MITIFSVPKSFKDKFDIIQRNAITSWTLLQPRPEIILIGNEYGTKELCEELGLLHISEVELNQYGTPYINDIFNKGQDNSSFDTVCYTNCDIIFTEDLIDSVNKVLNWSKRFLIVGRRWDIEINNIINFDSPGWQNDIKKNALVNGIKKPPTWIDYFIFPNGTFLDLPPFAVGRPGWDNWFVWNAINHDIPVVDATDNIVPIHQNHDYSHMPYKSDEGIWYGKEAVHNYSMLDGLRQFYKITDANYRLDREGVKRNLTYEHFAWVIMRRYLIAQLKLRVIAKYLGLKKIKKIIFKPSRHAK